MRNLAVWILALGIAAAPAVAADGPGSGTDNGKATNAADAKNPNLKDAANKAKPEDKTTKPSLEEEIDEMRAVLRDQAARLAEQQREIEDMKAELARTNSMAPAISAEPALGVSASGQPSGTAAATVVASNATAPVVRSAETPRQSGSGNSEGPASITFKGVTLTPGGYFAAESVWRQRALSADVNTPFNSVPFAGSSQSKVSEFNASARQSRISMLVEGKVKNAKLSGYYETDFLSAGVTSNNNQSNSYTLRQRQFWAQAALDSGWTFTGGQMWSLVTERKSGLSNRTEAPPLTIDAQYSVGFSWARQYAFRVTKEFNKKAWLGFAVEGPQTILTAHGNNNDFLIGAPGTNGGLLPATNNFSFNKVPDFIVKAAFEPGWGHYEIFGIYSAFRARIFPGTPPSVNGAFNDTRSAGGAGFNARMPLVAKKVDFGIHALVGDGVGRYGTGGLSDVTVRPDGTLAPLRAGQALATLETHPTPAWDIYFNYGYEYAARGAYTIGVAGEGYGSPLFNNTGCGIEILPGNNTTPGALGACTGDTKSLQEGTAGLWYRFYKGSYGTLQLGLQYSYVVRSAWSGVGGSPHNNENMVFTSFRYYIP
jgi:hypothetical protein